MAEHEYPRLCGGTFFVLLREAVKQRQKARNRMGGGSDGLKDTDLLLGLIRVVQPDFFEPPASTFAQNTSAYKACKLSSGTYLPFADSAFTASFDDRVKNEYVASLSAMSRFVQDYIDLGSTEKHIRLVKALIDLICLDASIADTEQFYANRDGTPLTKKALCATSDAYLSSFLLGAWHYIVVNRPENTIGRTTYEAWHEEPEVAHSQWRYCASIGDGVTRKIDVTFCNAEDIPAAEEPIADSHSASEEPPPPEPSAFVTNQHLNAPAVFFNSGANCTQIHNEGIININRSEKHG